MSKIKLDLTAFKHVKSDDKTTTLRHKDGHDLVLAHNALSKEGKGQLEALSKMSKEHMTETQANEAKDKYAEGGDVKSDDANKKENYKKDDKKESPETIKETSAANGVDAANEVRKTKKLPHGATLLINEIKRRKLAEGGLLDSIVKTVQDYHNESDPDKPQAEVNRDPNRQKAAQAQSEVRGFAEGGEVPDYLSGNLPEAATPSQRDLLQDAMRAPTDLDTKSMIDRSINTEMDKIKAPVPEGVYTGQDPLIIEREALKSTNDKQDAEKRSAFAKEAETKYQLDRLNAERTKMGLPVKSLDQPQTAPAVPEVAPSQGLVQQTMGQATAPQAAPPQAGYATDPNAAVSQGLQGIQEEAKAVGALGQQQAAMQEKYAATQANAINAYQERQAALDSERQALLEDYKDGHVDPNKFWTGDKDGNGSHSKLAAGIGMILAGFNPTNRPNAAIEFLNKQMDMNLQAQMKNMDAKNNLLSHNFQQSKNLREATDMTRIMQTDVLIHDLEKAAATAKSPMAQAAAKQAAAKFTLDNGMRAQQLAMMQGAHGLAQGDDDDATAVMIRNMSIANPALGKQMGEAFVPGFGMTKALTPISGDVKQELVGKLNFDRMAKEYIAFAKSHSGDWSPSDIAKGSAMAAELQGAYRQASKGGVYKEGEQTFIERLIPSDPTQYLASLRTLPKVEQLIHNNSTGAITLAKTNGLPKIPKSLLETAQSKSASANKSAEAWAKANPKDPRAAQILKAIGK